VGFMM